MPRIRISTTVDESLLSEARQLLADSNDATLIDHALEALLRAARSAAHDRSYGSYDQHPIDEPDEWGDLETFRTAAGRA